MRHILILSDLHLWQVTDHDDMWMRYRHRQFAPDAQLFALIERVYAQIGSAPLELVLNGDIFDFDVPPVVDGRATPAPSPRNGRAASARLAAILDDHELFIEALARVLSRGDRVLSINYNSSRSSWPALLRRLLSSASCAVLPPRKVPIPKSFIVK